MHEKLQSIINKSTFKDFALHKCNTKNVKFIKYKTAIYIACFIIKKKHL